MLCAAVVIGFPALLTGCVQRAESDVVVYSALDQEFASPILDAFERSTDHETGVIPKFDVQGSARLIGRGWLDFHGSGRTGWLSRC